MLAPQAALAQNFNGSSGTGSSFNGSAGCGSGGGTFQLCNPLGFTSFCDLVKSLLNVVLAIGVPIAVLFLVWAGFRFILARGSEQGLRDAKRNFQYVIIGIAVFLGAWTLATIISATIQSLPGGSSVNICGRS